MPPLLAPEPLADRHDVSQFSNGVHHSLDQWLRDRARSNEGLSARTYVVCTRDNAISPGTQRFMAARAGQVVEWDTDHSPFLTRPGDLADLLASRC